MNPIDLLNDLDKFKANCSGRGCNRKPIKYLKINFIYKIGKFCETCAADLLHLGLAEEICVSNPGEGAE